MWRLQQKLHQNKNLRVRIISLIMGIFFTTVVFAFMPYLIKDKSEKIRLVGYTNYVDVIRIKKKKRGLDRSEKRKEEKKIVSKKIRRLISKPVYIASNIKVKHLDIPFESNPKLSLTFSDIPIQPVINGIDINNTGIKGAFTINEVDFPPVPVVQIPPMYPMLARIKGIEGWVIVRFIVDKEGKTRNIYIIKSKPKGVFEDTVIKCISKWRFKPAIFEGIKVRTLVQTKICFKLD